MTEGRREEINQLRDKLRELEGGKPDLVLGDIFRIACGVVNAAGTDNIIPAVEFLLWQQDRAEKIVTKPPNSIVPTEYQEDLLKFVGLVCEEHADQFERAKARLARLVESFRGPHTASVTTRALPGYGGVSP